MHRLALVVLLSCGGSHVATPQASAGRASLIVRDSGVGPIDANAKASLDGLRALLPGYELESESQHDLGPPDVYVSAGGERLLIVAPSEHEQVMAVHAVSPRVESQIGWRVGETLADTTLISSCECLGSGLTCFAKGGSVGAVIDEDCMRKLEADAMAGRTDARAGYKKLEGGDPAALAALKSRRIRMLVWRPLGQRDRSDDPPPPPPED